MLSPRRTFFFVGEDSFPFQPRQMRWPFSVVSGHRELRFFFPLSRGAAKRLSFFPPFGGTFFFFGAPQTRPAFFLDVFSVPLKSPPFHIRRRGLFSQPFITQAIWLSPWRLVFLGRRGFSRIPPFFSLTKNNEAVFPPSNSFTYRKSPLSPVAPSIDRLTLFLHLTRIRAVFLSPLLFYIYSSFFVSFLAFSFENVNPPFNFFFPLSSTFVSPLIERMLGCPFSVDQSGMV